MTAATMIAMHYHLDSTKLALEAGSRCDYFADAVTGVIGNHSIFSENTIFVFRDGSMLRLHGGFALTAGKKGVFRRYRTLDYALGCTCSVCWAHNYCDALKLFPLTDTELSRPFIDYYRYSDYTAQFKREQRTSARVERSSS